jgi:hypothetical protein
MRPTAKYYNVNFILLLENRTEPYTKPRIATIEQHLRCALKHGDVINFDDFRALDSFIVFDDGQTKKFIRNKDKSGSGYISVPIKITRTLSDAIKYYSQIETDLISDIALSQDDRTVKDIFKTVNDLSSQVEVSYSPHTERINIVYKNIYKDFPITATQDDIVSAFLKPITQEMKPPTNKSKKKSSIYKSLFKKIF